MSKLIDELKNHTTTENGATAFKSTKSAVLDFFALGAAIRSRNAFEQVNIFKRAFEENKNLALRTMFYCRDIRGGQGERRAFRNQLLWLAQNEPEWVLSNMGLVPEFGRWDDLFSLLNTLCETDLIEFLSTQLEEDLTAKHPSLLAKWMPSENTSSKTTRYLAQRLRVNFGMTSRQYRKLLSGLRARLRVVERSMSAKAWAEIEYAHVPSQAMLQYRKAFKRHDQDRFDQYLSKVKSGAAKINTGTLHPHQICEKALRGEDSDSLEMLWTNLPDYTEGQHSNSICVVDTSASMRGLPINVALSLGLYCGERITGLFKNHFITFSANPELQTIRGKSLFEKFRNMSQANWNMNTNLGRVFDLILETAVCAKVQEHEMIEKIFIISDMQFDKATSRPYHIRYEPTYTVTSHQRIKQAYNDAGYKLPEIVFWNVDARNDNQPVKMHETGVQLVSGFSPSILKNVLAQKSLTPYDLMLEVLNGERYDCIIFE